jgi:methionyl-tRNA formyltransferase
MAVFIFFDFMRIIYLGTPDFAVPPLEILLENGYEIPAVVTAPDKPGGRQGMMQSAVKQAALAHGLPVLQPERLRSPAFIEELRTLKADLQIVVAFRMLPEVVWNMPPLGTLNLHGSLLPRYRGAAPINWAIINGEKETGITTFLLKHEIDTGDILFQERIPISENETVGELYQHMMHQGAALVLKTVRAIENGTARPQPQKAAEITHAPKIFTETCHINFARPVQDLHNFVRGLSPHPGAWTVWNQKTVKIYRTLKTKVPAVYPPGTWQVRDKQLFISTSDFDIQIEELQMEGKKRMDAKDFLNGYKVEIFS